LPNSPRLNVTVAHTLSKASVGQLLRHEADQRARGAVLANDVVAVDEHLPALGLTIPQMMLISVVLPAPFGPSSAKISPRRTSR
jgi:hypothetical protein